MPRLGLALSGGGFRATLYHLGVIRFLKDAGQLEHVTDVASVSGGSILAAHLVLNWDRYSGDDEKFDEAVSEIIKFVQFDVRNHVIRRLPLQYVMRWLVKFTPFDGGRFTPNACPITVGVQTVGREIVGRTAPTLLDLVVAIAAGTAGAFAATRRSVEDAIPGVAIAVALVPPLCVVGIGLALGKSAIPEVGLVLTQGIAVGALLLFLANLAGIVFSGALVYILQGYGRWSTALRGITVSVLVMVALAYPLMFSLDELLTRQDIHRHLAVLRYERPDIYRHVIMRRLAVDIAGEAILVDVELIAPRSLDVDIPQETERIREYLTEKTGRDVEIKSTVIRADVIVTRARPSVSSTGS